METDERITVNPEDGITVKLEDSKGMVDRLIAFSSLILIPVVGLGLGIWMEYLTDQQTTNYNNKFLGLQTQVENTKQLNNYLDKVGKIISEKTISKNSIIIDNRPVYLLPLVAIKQIDHLTSAYTRNLNPESKRNVLIYLYESGLINHTKAENKVPGTEGLCKENQGQDLYCTLSTNRYYFDDVDMSGLFLKNIKLNNSYLNRANFTNADLYQAELNGSGFRKANFTSANLRGANFSSIDEYNETVLKGANFTNADLKRANLTKADLTEADLQGAIFGDDQCTEENKIKDWETNKKLTLNCANLDNANLTGAKNIDIDEIKKAYSWRSVKGNDVRNKLGLKPQ